MSIPTARPKQAPIAMVGRKMPAGTWDSIQQDNFRYFASHCAYHHAERPSREPNLDNSGEQKQEHVLPHSRRVA